MTRPALAAFAAFAALALSACATGTVERSLTRVDELARPAAGAPVALARSDQDRTRAAATVDSLLEATVDAAAAVRIALAGSPAVQVLLAEQAQATAASLQNARPGNPTLTLERLVRGDVVEIGRLLSIGLVDLLSLPSRSGIAETQIEAGAIRAASDIVRKAVDARMAWVEAVAASQAARYADDVLLAAEAGDELARRMKEAGNFNRLQQAREQAFRADAIARQMRASHAALAARERLVRVLGLSRDQATRLRLPDRLPDLPPSAREESTLRRHAFDARLDVQLAHHELTATAKRLGLTRVTSWVDAAHVGVARNSESGEPVQRGFEIELPLPLFDTGDAKRAGAEAAYLAALARTAQVAVEARSQVAEAYSAYRTAYRLARQYQDEVVPLQQAIAEENLLRYNGMLISVFELLADARAQIGAVVAAIEAQRDFWLADYDLDATLAGRAPVARAGAGGDAPPAASATAAAH